MNHSGMIVSSDYLRVMHIQTHQRRQRRAWFAVLGVMVIGSYFMYQLRDWILLPDLSVDRPADGITFRGPHVVVEGTATPGVRLTVNGVTAYNEENGYFRAELLLPAGLHTIRIIAENRFGRRRALERQVVVEDSEPVNQ